MTEVWFYHLQRQPLERVLPALIEKSLQRGWRVVVQAASEERVAALDEVLWTFTDESFIAHGTKRDGDCEMQPVFLTTGPENPNGAVVRFFVEGVQAGPVLATLASGTVRAMIVFEGSDPDQVTAARAQWRELKEAGHAVTYWQQNGEGQWEKKA